MLKPQFNINLPNLLDYKKEFEDRGIQTPLAVVPFSKAGLLPELPTPPDGKTGWPWTIETPPPATPLPQGATWPKISIVMPSYNQAQWVEQTIRSVLLQNYPNLELVVCDGGSSDETVSILEKYSPWISFWQSEKDRGQGHAINLGFSICSGDYFGWINSDDFYLPSSFNAVASLFTKTLADFVYGDAISVYDESGAIDYWQGNFVLDRYLWSGGLIASHAAFWRSTVHVPLWEDLNCAIDYELWRRLLPGKKRVHLRLPLGACTIQSQSKTVNEKYRELWRQDDEKIISAYGLLPSPRSFLRREFSLFQRFYKSFNRSTNNINLEYLQRK